MKYKLAALAIALGAASINANATLITSGHHHGHSCGSQTGSTQPECTDEWSDSWTGHTLLAQGTASSTWSYVFDITDDGFNVGEDQVNDYSLSFSLADDTDTVTRWSWSSWGYVQVTDNYDNVTEYAYLTQPGSSSYWEVDLSNYGFNGTVQGRTQLNNSGQLSVSLSASSGDFWLNGAELLACGIDNIPELPQPPATNVPEPGSIALLGLGLAGLGFARRKRANA